MRAEQESAEAALRQLQLALTEARAHGCPLRLVGGDTKAAWWQTEATRDLSLRDYRGVVRYEPSELVVTARAGTPLAELEGLLAGHGQCLASEPPRLGPGATVGGAVAAGLSGPARPWRGSLRDHVLGVKLLSGQGEVLRFGGEVMKNVAGYDVSRLCAGAWGRLGPMLEISLRVAPIPASTMSASWQMDTTEAARHMAALRRSPHPLSGCLYLQGQMHIRLSGATAAVEAALASLRPAQVEEGDSLWAAWRDYQHPFFQQPGRIWRVSVPPASSLGQDAPDFAQDWAQDWAHDWAGALRWYRARDDDTDLEARVTAEGGFCRPWREPGFAATRTGALGSLEQRVLSSFDPDRLFNRMTN